jgi:2-methylcitrate dehydratase PrpD
VVNCGPITGCAWLTLIAPRRRKERQETLRALGVFAVDFISFLQSRSPGLYFILYVRLAKAIAEARLLAKKAANGYDGARTLAEGPTCESHDCLSSPDVLHCDGLDRQQALQ